MASHRQTLRDARSREAPGAYVLIVRRPDGRPRLERFDDAATYRARLTALQHVHGGGVSIEDLLGLLDA